MRSIWAMARLDLAIWLRSPGAIAAALLPALGMGILLAVLTNSVGQQPVALVVQSQGRFTKRMAGLIRDDAEAYLLKEMTSDEAERAIGEQQVAAIIVIPENFEEAVSNGDGILDLYLNNIDIDLSDDIRRSVTRSVAEFDAPQLGVLGELHAPGEGQNLPNPYRVAVTERDLRTTNVSFLQYQVIPILVLIVISCGLLGTALLTARDFARKTAKVMVLSPAKRLSLVLGRLLGGSIITFALVIPLLAIGLMTKNIPYCADEASPPMFIKLLLSGPCAWILPVPSASHALALIALLIAVTLATVGMGVLIGILIRDERLVTMTGLNLAAYLFFLGGGFTTVAFLPNWIQRVSDFVPTKYAIDGLRQALFYPDLIGFSHDLLILGSCALVSVVIAVASLMRVWRRA